MVYFDIIPENHLKEFSEGFDDRAWKESIYWREEMDVVLVKYLKVLEEVFRMYSGLRTMPGKQKFMSLGELENFVSDFRLDSRFPQNDIAVCFNQAMMSQIDELDSERCAEMSFVEFLEAFSRVADFSNLTYIDKDESEEWSSEKIQNQNIWIKTEALLRYVYNTGKLDKKRMTGFVLPSKSFFNSKFELIDVD